MYPFGRSIKTCNRCLRAVRYEPVLTTVPNRWTRHEEEAAWVHSLSLSVGGNRLIVGRLAVVALFDAPRRACCVWALEATSRIRSLDVVGTKAMGNGASTEIEIFAEGELEAEFKRRGGAGDISIKKLIKKGYNDVIQTVIRPTRQRYDVERELGEDAFGLPSPVPLVHHGRDEAEAATDGPSIVRRRDFELENDRGLKLQCSQWHIYADEQSKLPQTTPCLVYLHSNMGSRCDALRIRDQALRRGFSVFAFDFSGSGLSDGIYVTMGWNESKDLHFVLQYLEEDDAVESISFYAHSMGTFPAIVNVACRSIVKSKSLKAKLDSLPSCFRAANANVMGKPIKGMVLDGAYANMSLLTEELLVAVQEEGFKVPLSLMKLACAVVRQSVKKRADVDLELLRPIDFVKACRIPALFLTGEDDRYVGSHHSDLLVEKYGGPGVIMRVPGDHYTPRKDAIYADAFDFLLGAIRSVGMQVNCDAVLNSSAV